MFEYRDKIPLKRGYEELGVRVVPPAVAQYGSFLSRCRPDAELREHRPGVGPNTMVGTWTTVGSGAQIGADVHLAGGVGIGGVLEPRGARPVIVEDGVFVGSRAVIVEGVVVGERAVIGPHVVLSASGTVIDVTGAEPVEHRGYVPPARSSYPACAKGLSGGHVRPPIRPDRWPAGGRPT